MSEKLLTFITFYNRDPFSQIEKELIFFTYTVDIDNFLIFWYDRVWGFFSLLRQDDWQKEMRISHNEKQCIFTQPRLEESNNCPKTQAQVSRAGGDLFQETPLTKMPGMLSQAKTQAEIGQNTTLPCLLPCCWATLFSCSHIYIVFFQHLTRLCSCLHSSSGAHKLKQPPPHAVLPASSSSCPLPLLTVQISSFSVLLLIALMYAKSHPTHPIKAQTFHKSFLHWSSSQLLSLLHLGSLCLYTYFSVCIWE